MKTKRIKFIALLAVLIIILSMLSGCALFSNEIGKMKEALMGRTAIVQTYDEESNIIDSIKGSSISISSEDKFNSKDEEGNTINKSSVINLTIGGKSMVHVGSSLILYEEGLTDIFNEYSKTVDIQNIGRSTPFVNRMVNDMKNFTTGKSRVVLIRSQSGKPLATFAGNKVSYFATGIDKSTGILIDGKYLFIYRCDYTIYDTELLE
ncbi:DUF5052 domain-containing protein [Tissierella sp. P1]|jgi:hypothetical protein|uniref:DUF5052 family protein n=1 Tax=unclassified Tissierella TaxID=2638726 RepID=UPI000BA0966D|nr:DUF5052 family protein [Tissierella sp. P1]OZV10393.1 DUF5052 domain-containing protein [Tissierella sp. P1]